jgi:hypothetical protein
LGWGGGRKESRKVNKADQPEGSKKEALTQHSSNPVKGLCGLFFVEV